MGGGQAKVGTVQYHGGWRPHQRWHRPTSSGLQRWAPFGIGGCRPRQLAGCPGSASGSRRRTNTAPGNDNPAQHSNAPHGVEHVANENTTLRPPHAKASAWRGATCYVWPVTRRLLRDACYLHGVAVLVELCLVLRREVGLGTQLLLHHLPYGWRHACLAWQTGGRTVWMARRRPIDRRAATKVGG